MRDRTPPFMSVREKDNPELYARIQDQNLLRQYDLLSNCVEIGLEKGIEAFDKYTLWALNYAAVANIAQFGGRYREEPIYVGKHYLICLKQGKLLPGRKIVPERIRENRRPYYDALEAADRAWDDGKLDVSVMAKYLEELLKGQLTEK